MNELQSKILAIYKEVKHICERHDLRYYAIGGTCIGAVRHKGFIPWDDDLDIAMPNDDYKKFLAVANYELPRNMHAYETASLRHNPSVFMKVHLLDTTFIEPTEIWYPDSYKGVYIDIMPLYGIPADTKTQKRYIKRIKRYIRLNQMQRQKCTLSQGYRRMIFWILSKPVNMILPHGHWTKRWKNEVKKYDYCKSQYTGYVWADCVSKLVFPISWFRDTVQMQFEDTVIRCPIDFDKYLTHQFGNYMQMPPENERKTMHQGSIIDLRKAYTEYQLDANRKGK